MSSSAENRTTEYGGKEGQRIYIAIDLKSFYASVECQERGLDPLTTNLVVADVSRTEKTICLAVSPSLKAYGIPGRARLFEVVQKVREINVQRRLAIHGQEFRGKSADAGELAADPYLELDYVAATPEMSLYLKRSAEIYRIYLQYIAPEDIHVYSIDEVFMDVTEYLNLYQKTPHELAMEMIRKVLKTTGITATAGIGTNLYLAKVAMDVVAKHIPADHDGVRIAELTETGYRRQLWTHQPLTDFWRVGAGIAQKLQRYGMYTMGDVARCSIKDEDLLYHLFGVNAEFLIDHAWGWEPCRISDIKAYQPENRSLGSGQVLACPYDYEKAELIVREMTDQLVLNLVEKQLVTDQMVLTVGYDRVNMTDAGIREQYQGSVTADWYGRTIPKHAHGSIHLGRYTSSTRLITDAMMKLFRQVVNPLLKVRRVYVVANHVKSENEFSETGDKSSEQNRHTDNPGKGQYVQMDLFSDFGMTEKNSDPQDEEKLAREKRIQKAVLAIQKKYGKNSILKGMNLEDGATAIERNRQIGGHKA